MSAGTRTERRFLIAPPRYDSIIEQNEGKVNLDAGS